MEVCSHSGLKPSIGCHSKIREWFKKGTEPRQICTFHRKGNDHHQIPQQYAGWINELNEKGIDSPYSLLEATRSRKNDPIESISQEVPPGQPVLIGSSVSGTIGNPHSPNKGVRILYPLDDDRFLLEDVKVNPTISIKAETTQAESRLTWFIDGVEFQKTGPPYRTRWELEKGTHTLSVAGSSGLGDSVRVVVE